MGEVPEREQEVTGKQLARVTLRQIFILKALGADVHSGEKLRELLDQKNLGEQGQSSFSCMMKALEDANLITSQHTTRCNSGKTIRGKTFSLSLKGFQLVRTVNELLSSTDLS